MKNLLVLCSLFVFVFASKSVLSSENLQWQELEFKGASGVPLGTQHQYNLEGVLHIVKTQSKTNKFAYVVTTSQTTKNSLVKSFWASVIGDWDTQKNIATERINFSGELTGNLKSVFKCSKDPWLYETSCTVMETKFSTNESPSRDWPGLVSSTRKPLTIHRVNIADATHLAKNANTPPPPPPSAKPNTEGKSFMKPKKEKPVVPVIDTTKMQVEKLETPELKEENQTITIPEIDKSGLSRDNPSDKQLKRLKQLKLTEPKEIIKKAEEKAEEQDETQVDNRQ